MTHKIVFFVSDSIVIIPTYNELENIGQMVHKVFSLPKEFHLLIVDDGSPDGTAAEVKKLQGQYPDKLHLLERTEKKGLGTAYIAGFKWVLDHNYAFVFEMDCDFSHNPDDLVHLYEACAQNGADLAIGSRYGTGVYGANWTNRRGL